MKMFRAGIIVPWMNTAMEDEIPIFISNDVGLHWNRMAPSFWPKDEHDESYLASMHDDIGRALRNFTHIKLDTIIIGCTSIQFAPSIYANSSCASYNGLVTIADTILFSYTDRNAPECYLFGPYSDRVLDAVGVGLEESGITIAKSYPIKYSGQIRDIPQKAIAETIINSDIPKGACAIICCTALYTNLVGSLLSQLGRPDIQHISSNSSVYEYINAKSRT